MVPSRLLRLFSLLLVVLCVAGTACAQAFQTVVVFGDSLSDTGNHARLSQNKYGLAGRVPGTAANYTDGRFTDGTDTLPAARNFTGVWAEQLAASFSTKPAVKASLDGGTNYAYGFATTANGTSVDSYGPNNFYSVTVENIGQQVSDYLATSPTINAQTLFIVWGGANDLLNATSPADIANAATREVAIVQRLINAGATNFIVPNLPPLGLIPRLNGSPTLSVPATQAAAGFNQVLAAGLAALPAMNPGKTLHLYPLDVYTLFNFVVGPPIAGGLANVTASSQTTTSAPGNYLLNPDTYLFWDDLHPTTAGHHLIELAASTLLNPVTTATTVASTNLNANLNSSVTLTAAVSGGSGALSPHGYVTFLDGATVLGTSAVVSSSTAGTSTATYTTAALAAGVHTITAAFTGVNGFGNSNSGSIAQAVTAPSLTSTLSPSALTVSRGASGTVTVTLTPAGGFTGTAQVACGMPPAHVTCGFSATTFTFTSTSTAQTSTLTISTKDMTSSLRPFGLSSGTGIALAGLPCLGLLALYRRRNLRGLRLLCIALLMSGGLFAMGGCGSGNNTTVSSGTYTIPVVVVATTSAGSSSTVLNVALTVQ